MTATEKIGGRRRPGEGEERAAVKRRTGTEGETTRAGGEGAEGRAAREGMAKLTGLEETSVGETAVQKKHLVLLLSPLSSSPTPLLLEESRRRGPDMRKTERRRELGRAVTRTGRRTRRSNRWPTLPQRPTRRV